jgi:hypothetical protein
MPLPLKTSRLLTGLARLTLLHLRWLDPSHHLFLGNEMINPLQQSQQALHVSAPLVQDIIRILGFGETDDASGTIDPRVDGLGSDQFRDVLLRLVLAEIEQLSESGHADASVVLGNDADIVLDNPLTQILPSLMSLFILLVSRSSGSSRSKDVRLAEVWAEAFSNHRPTHELRNGELLNQCRLGGDLGIPSIAVDTVEEVRLLIIVRSEDDEVDDSLKGLE